MAHNEVLANDETRRPESDDPALSIENLNQLIATMPEWSRKRPWTPEQTAAWRLRWFGRTPEDDVRAREEYHSQRDSELSRGFDRFAKDEREPFNDWPNSQGSYD